MIIGIASGKGGVGKSSLSSNLSYYYSKLGKKVLLIDMDWGMSNLSYFFNTYNPFSIYNFLFENLSWDQIKHKINDNLDLIGIGHGKKELVNLTKENQLKIIDSIQKDKDKYDLIIIDSSPGIHENIITFLEICNRIVVITTSMIPAIANAYGLIKVLKLNYDIDSEIYLVVNMESNKKSARLLFENVKISCHKFLHFDLKYLGNINNSNNIQYALKNYKIFMKDYYDTIVAKQIKVIGDILCTTMKTQKI